MTTTHTPTRRASTGPSRSASDVARAIGAALTLAVFVIGVPAALLVVAPLSRPESWPTWDAARTALTRPDDGTLLIGAVQLVAWGAWATFTFSVVTELIATIRHVEVPSIPLLGWTQHAAATLLTTAGLLFATSSPGLTIAAQQFAFVAAAPDHAQTDLTALPAMTTPGVTMTTPGVMMTEAMTGTLRAMTPARIPMTGAPASPRTATDADHHPVISVTRGDTLWGLAERHLGSGLRYAEIRDLNLGRPQPDGRTLTDTHWIYPGWQLRLPLDATALPTPASAPAEQAATAAPEQAATAAPEQAAPAAPAETAAIPDHAAVQLARPGPLASSEPAPIGSGNAVPPTRTGAPTAAPMAVAAANSKTDDASDDDDPGFPVTQLFLGLTGLAAAGIVGELARRRHLQHRTRRTGERIPLPAPGSPADDAERTLRAAAPPLSIAQLKAALLNLATRCFTAERDLPRIGTILLSEQSLELHLVDDDTDPVEPFVSAGPRIWSATTANVADDEPLADDPDRPEPYPALVTLGHTDDATVIVNLEAAGTLAVDGDPEAARDVLRALVVELATSDLTGRIGLITGPEFAGLAGVSDSARLQCTDHSTLAAQHAERQRAVVDILGGAGVEDTLQARSDRTAEDVWLPVIYLDDATEAETPWRPVAPWSGSVLLTTTVAASGAWTLTVPSTGVATLEPTGRRLFPTRLTQEDLDRITDLLATAAPAPATDVHFDVTTRPVAKEITEALAALPASPAPEEPGARATQRTGDGLRINVLGPIEIDGLPRGDIPLSKRSTELLVYLALRGKATGPELDEALWHGQRVDNQTRNSLLYRTRQRVGADNIPLVDADGHYRLGPDVTCDWRTFQALARAGFAAGVGETDHLWAALGVVRNRPFLGIDDAAYTWAERDIQQMISAIVDTSHVLSRVLLDANDHRGAAEAAVIGIGVEQCSELLYGDVMAAARAQGDLGEVSRLSARLNAVLEQLDPDYATA